MASGGRGRAAKAKRRARRYAARKSLWSYGCRSGKLRYPSRFVAEKERKRINAKGGPHLRELKRVYLCPDCDGWHSTSWE